MIARLCLTLLGLLLCTCGDDVPAGVEDAPDLEVRRGEPKPVSEDAITLHADVVASASGELLSIAEVEFVRLTLDQAGSGTEELIETEVEENTVRAEGLVRGRYRLKIITDSMEEVEREFVVRPGSYVLRLRLQVVEIGVVNGRIFWDGVPVEERPGAVLVQFESTASARWLIQGARRAVAIQSIDLRRTDRFILEIPDREARVRFHIVDPNWRGEVSTVASPGSPRDVKLIVRRR